jgi:Ni/Co efflux regulator RcnB
MVIAIAAGVYSAPTTAAKPAWAGNNGEERGKSHKKQGKEKAHKQARHKAKKPKNSRHFNDKHESVVRRYYQDESRNGKGCPPGLAKKNNGCLPPGQAKKQWATGKPLPHDVEQHELPRDLLSRLPIPPKGKRYVRILTDVLLIDTSTDVVIDALVDVLIP